MDKISVVYLFIAAVFPVLITSVAGVIIAVISSRKIDRIHVLINSRVDQLLAASIGQARAEGKAEGPDPKTVKG